MARWCTIDHLITVLAGLTCVVVVLGLFDTPRQAVTTAPAVTLPEGTLGDAELSVAASDAEGRALSGVTFTAFYKHGDNYYWVGRRHSGRNGRAHFAELPHGVVWLLAEKAGYSRTSTQVALSSEPREARVRLGTAHRLALRAVDDAGEPVVGATVLVEDADPVPHGALTDATGAATFDRLNRGPWQVRVSARGFATERVTTGEDTTVTLRHLGMLAVHVVDQDGAPAADATVVIAGAKLWPARKTTTDATGVALVTGLLDGSYDLRASRGALVSQTLFGFPLTDGRRDEVTLTLGVGRMVRVLVLDGDTDGAAPIPGADVVLVEGGVGSFPLRGRTDSAGELMLGPVPPGPATVGARADGFVARSGVPVPDDASDVRIGLLRGATLTGTVVDADGYPIAGASIEVVGSDLFGFPVSESPLLMNFNRAHFAWGLAGPVALVPAGELGVMPGPVPPIPGLGPVTLPAAGDLDGEQATEAIDPWVTRSNGDFVAHPVTPGRVRALVRHPDFVETLSDEVTLTPGGRASVRVELFRGGILEGRVNDHRGFPVFGANIELRAIRGTYERFATTAQDGSFAFAAVPKQVVVSVAGVDQPGRSLLREHLEVAEGQRTEVELTLPEPREPIEISVVGDHDEPISMAQVTVASLDPNVPRRETYFTDEGGRVQVPDFAGLPLEVRVEAMGFAPARLQRSDGPLEIEVSLQAGVRIAGRVTEVRGRFPVAAAQVTLVFGGQRRLTLTDATGAFEFDHIPIGAARLSVDHPEHASVAKDIRITDTGRSDRPLELEPIDLAAPGGVSGVVVDTAGSPVPGARVAVGFVPAYLPAGALPPGVATTDADGRFLLEGLSPGTVELGAYAADIGRGQLRDVTVQSGSTAQDLVLRLDKPVEAGLPNVHGNVAITLGEQGPAGSPSVVVVSVAAASEAERAGLKSNDQIVAVDGQPVRDMLEARSLLTGAVGSQVVVEVLRSSQRLVIGVAREQVRR